jgi:hypothetical protein
MTLTTRLGIFWLVVAIVLLAGLCLILIPSDNERVYASIGTSLVASGIVLLLESVYRRITDEDAAKLKGIMKSGLSGTYERRDLDVYHQLMTAVSNRLDVSGFSLRNFYESFDQVLIQRLNKCPGLRVRFLVVDPASEQSTDRETLEGHTPGTFRNSIAALKSTFDGYSRVEIRTLGSPLTSMVFRIDSVMFVGPQFVSVVSKQTITLEIHENRDSWMFRAFESEFDALWRLASPVVLEGTDE